MTLRELIQDVINVRLGISYEPIINGKIVVKKSTSLDKYPLCNKPYYNN